MRITSWNIQHGIAYKSVTSEVPDLPSNLSQLHREIASSVYTFQEVDCRLPRSGEINQPEELSEVVDAVDFRFAPTVIGEPGLKSVMPELAERRLLKDECNFFSGYGNLTISTVPVKKWLRYDLGKSPIGAPLLIGMGSGQRLIVAPDELRVATAAVLENGWTVINTHLSFVPGYNVKQLRKLINWAEKIESGYETRVVIAGDLNLPGKIIRTISPWKSPIKGATFPQWKPAIEFDHFLLREVADVTARCEEAQIFGDHLPITLESKQK